MNIALWIVQGLLAAMYLMAGQLKVEGISDRQSKGTNALGKEPLGCFRPVCWDLGTARRTGIDPAHRYGHPALVNSSRGHRTHTDPIVGNYYRAFAKEGIQRYSRQHCFAGARCVRDRWALDTFFVMYLPRS